MDAKTRLIVRALTHLAWADGELGPEEQTWLHRLFQQLGVSEEEARRAVYAPDQEPEYETLARLIPDRPGRLELMTAMLRLAFADKTLLLVESEILRRMARALAFDLHDLQALKLRVANGEV